MAENHSPYNTRMEKDREQLIQQAEILLDRLERLSADSTWAHRASGIRGALIRSLPRNQTAVFDQEKLSALLEQGFKILILAAKEIPDHRENNS